MKVTIADYGLSNLLSVCRAVEKLGYEPSLATTGAQLREADILILPGVGAFADGMAGLISRGMLEPIWGCAQSGVPILGICLGMQMLFEAGFEYGRHRGLGLIPGTVERIPDKGPSGTPLRVPHIGWEGLLPHKGSQTGFSSPLLQNTAPGEEVYFVHSFVARPKHTAHILAECDYEGTCLCAMVGNENVFGAQFHPEKSGEAGLAILSGFLRLSAAQHQTASTKAV